MDQSKRSLHGWEKWAAGGRGRGGRGPGGDDGEQVGVRTTDDRNIGCGGDELIRSYFDYIACILFKELFVGMPHLRTT